MKHWRFIWTFFISLQSIIAWAQPTLDSSTDAAISHFDSAQKVRISHINIAGNKKTKAYIILREFTFREGDSIDIAALYKNLTATRNLIYNTNLFSIVTVAPYFKSAFDVDINVSLIERWYIYPTPQFKLTDRNFNEWYKTYNADFSRVTYGVKFTHYNLSGRGDQLNAILLNGFTRSIALGYSAPSSNANLNEGFSFAASVVDAKSFPYKTDYNHKLLQYNSTTFVKSSFFGNVSYRVRKGFFSRHIYAIQYNHHAITDSILADKYNPNYFNLSKSNTGFLDLVYNYQYINVDNINYPQQGKIISVFALKRGFGISGGVNMLALDFNIKSYHTHRHQIFSSFQLLTKLKLPFKQCYINQRAHGYGDFYMNGLEYNVIDGVAAGISKLTFGKKIIAFKIPVPFHIKAIPFVPFSFYAKSFGNLGFVYNKPPYQSRLNNKLLYSGGLGIDLLSLYDIKISVEYSFNQLGEKGLFLHSRSN
jgi:outer membrane protein assembly factor BamA